MRKLKAIMHVAALFLVTASAQAFDFKIETFKLKNDLEVVVIPDHRAPVVTQMIWYRVGAADEMAGKSGLAHFFEHLMFKGTPKNPAGVFDRQVKVNGGEQNAFTSQDFTAYFQYVPQESLSRMMALEADRMQNLVLSDAVLTPEREVVREERRLRTESDPSALLSEQVEAALYTTHPYGRPVVGWMSEVAALTTADALDFYKAHYTPANAILILVGDIKLEEAKALAEMHYGNLKNTFVPTARKRTEEPEPIAARRVTLVDERSQHSSFMRSYLTPSYRTGKGGEAYALELLSLILGEGSQSKIYKTLVVDKKLAASAGSWYEGTAYDTGTIGVYATPAPGISIDALEKAMDEIIDNLKITDISQQDLDRVRNKSIADMVYLLDDMGDMVEMVGSGLSTGLTLHQITHADDALKKVTVEDVKQVAQKYLALKRSVTGVLLQEEKKITSSGSANQSGAINK